MPAENPFLSSDEEVLYDDADGYGDDHSGVYDSKDVPMGVAADGFEISDTEGKDEQSNFNSDPFYKSLFHEIDSSNSDTNYSSSSTTSESLSVSDIDDMPTPTIYFDKDELDTIAEDDFEEYGDDDAERTIRYDRADEAVIPFQQVFVDNPQQDTDKEFLEDIRYDNSPIQTTEKVPLVGSTIKMKEKKYPRNVATKAKVPTKVPAADDKNNRKRRKRGKLKKQEEFMLYKVPEIEECLEFCDSHNATWEVQQQQLRVFCDYMRAAAINAQQKGKKLKKGDAIERASTLAFGKSIYIRGGGITPGSASDVISKAFHYITGYKRVKRNREKRKRSDDATKEVAEKTTSKFVNNKQEITNLKTEKDLHIADYKAIQMQETRSVKFPGNDTSSDITTDSDYDSGDFGESGVEKQNPTKRTKKKRRKRKNNGNDNTTTFIPSEAGFIPPALLFVVAPIMFVCFIAYGVATPNNYNAGLVSSSSARMPVKHVAQAVHDHSRKMSASEHTKAKSLESNFNVHSNEKKTVRHLRHALKAVQFVNDVKKKAPKTHVNKNVHKKIKKGKHTSNHHGKAGNHGTHPPRPKHLILKDFIRKGGTKLEKKGVQMPSPTPAGPSKHSIGSLKAIILAITGGATGVEHSQVHATGAETKHFY